MERLYADRLDGVGTYVKVVWSPDPSKAFIVLYLRPRGRFLFGGFWEGYEYSLAAGSWHKQGREIRLDGRETTQNRHGAGTGRWKVRPRFRIEDSNHTPVLRAASELSGWSLLGWSGDFVYVGPNTVIAPGWLPSSMSAVDARINELWER